MKTKTIPQFVAIALLLFAFYSSKAQLKMRHGSTTFEKIEPIEIFKANHQKQGSFATIPIKEYDLFSLDFQSLQNIHSAKRPALKLEVPINGINRILNLELFNPFTADFKVTFSSGLQKTITNSTFYRGVIEGEETSSIATISVFEDDVTVLISSENMGGNYVISKLKGSTVTYIGYTDVNLDVKNMFSCDVLEVGETEITPQNLTPSNSCVRVYMEVSHNFYQQLGSSINNTTNYVSGLFANVVTLYANESVQITLSELKIWDTPDPFNHNSGTSGMLYSFRDYIANTLNNTFNGDLAHIIDYGLNGGIAYVSTLCTYTKAYSSGVSSPSLYYQSVPTYSWSVEVLTHELGHNLGSNHTQWCGWPVGALDNCVSPEGNCSPGPYPANGGTIMSYCHLTNVGINFNNGFGQYPGDAIRNKISSVNCLQSCSSDPTCSDGIQNGNETGIDCGGPDCQPCATCNDSIQNGDELGIDCGGSDCPACATCDDGILNGDETGVDCGGSDCPDCDTSSSSCEENTIIIDLVFDSYGNETSWILVNSDGDTVVSSNGNYAKDFSDSSITIVECIPDDCYSFIIHDTYGDGMCCAYGEGSYTLIYDGDTLASGGEFEDTDTAEICLNTATCSDGIQNGGETGIDCGGSECEACITCNDGIQNGDETGIDCGGSDCPACTGCSENEVTIQIKLDYFPSETSWVLRNSSYAIVASSNGNYGNYSYGTLVEEELCLPNDCYYFTIYDSYGDGICCNYGNGYYLIMGNNNQILAAGGNFGYSYTEYFCLNTGEIVNTEANSNTQAKMPSESKVAEKTSSIEPFELSVFPVPATSEFTVYTTSRENPTYYITNVQGKIISTNTLNYGNNIVDASHLSPGVYSIQVVFGNKKPISKKLVIK